MTRVTEYKDEISKRFEGFLKDPKIALMGNYKDGASRAAMSGALALWMGLNPNSAFYRETVWHLVEDLREGQDFSQSVYQTAENAHIPELLSLMTPTMELHNMYAYAVCLYMSLPKDVARKWLWHENVDFQSCESFLRRLTDLQYQSLKLHWKLVKEGTDTRKLLCFTDGALNKVWRLFKLTFKESGRMDTKSALAHDFLGIGMGFKLYPNIADRTAEQGLTSQFLSKQDRGEFEVNKEHGGLYWFLYRKLRSNSLYGKDKNVELGRWICPGFWWYTFGMDNKIVRTLEDLRRLRKPIRNVNIEHKEHLSALDRVAVWITDNVGTMGFFLVIFSWTVVWLGWNIFATPQLRFDPYPAFVLWLFISNMLQIFLMPLLMIGQNLQGRHSEARAEADFEVNTKSEREIETILQHLENQNELILKILAKLEK